jgi:transposase IS116/IS110/IS902 family protein
MLGVQALAVLATLDAECASVDRLGEATTAAFNEHPDHQIITLLVGLADLTGARLLAEIGDDRRRFADARALKAFAGSAPVTKASGRSIRITHRHVKNNHLAAVGFVWAFVRVRLPGAHARALSGPSRSRRPPSCSPAPPLQPHARPALPLPANRPDLRSDQGLRTATNASRTRRRLTLNKIGGLWIGVLRGLTFTS